MTAEEFSQLEIEDWSDHYRFELIEGGLSVREPRPPASGCVLTNIVRHLGCHVREQGLGTVYSGGTSVFVNPKAVRAADVAFIPKGRLPLTDERWLLEPDLAVEVFSPSNHPRYIAQKVEHYLSVRTRLIWYIDPRRIDVYRADGSKTVLLPGDTLSGENVVEGFACNVTEILDT